MLNASLDFVKGDPKNYLSEDAIKRISDSFTAWKELDKYSRIVNSEEIANNDFNISPSRYIHTGTPDEYRSIVEIIEELTDIDEDAARTSAELNRMLATLMSK